MVLLIAVVKMGWVLARVHCVWRHARNKGAPVLHVGGRKVIHCCGKGHFDLEAYIETAVLVSLLNSLVLGRSGPWFNVKMLSYQYRKSHCRDKTILRLSYLRSGISYTGKMTSLYWIRLWMQFQKVIFNLVSLISIFKSLCDNVLRWMQWDLAEGKATLAQIMAWCQATSHYLSQCWPNPMSYGITKPQLMKSRPCNLFKGQVAIHFIQRYPIFRWVAVTWQEWEVASLMVPEMPLGWYALSCCIIISVKNLVFWTFLLVR